MPTSAPDTRIEPPASRAGTTAKAAAAPEEELPNEEPKVPEAMTRSDLLKYWINLSLDEKTANKMLWISEDGSKVSRMTDDVRCPVLDRPERYEYTPQVLCKQGVEAGRAYWEVEYTGWVVTGVAYEGAARRQNEGPCGLGENEDSWGLGWGGSRYQLWFSGINTEIDHVPQSSKIGVYLDHPAGLIHFYVVDEVQEEDGSKPRKEVRLLEKVKTSFKGKMMPGFWVGQKSSCSMLHRDI